MGLAGAEVIAGQLPKGKVVGKRWKILKKLGTGSFGAVYKVEDINTCELAALKAEAIQSKGNVLKLEAHILRRLAKCPMFVNILQSGKKEFYSYVVMTLLGPSLDTLIGHVGRVCTVSTQVRIGINALYGVKVLHDMGFIHRDLKPANMAVGSADSDRSRLIHIFDFGLAREYVFFSQNGRPKLRRPRDTVRFRGTLRYCSANTQERGEQGRMDDLWSLLHILVELRGLLPWSRAQYVVFKIYITPAKPLLFRTATEILLLKRTTPIEILLENCPVQLMTFHKHLSTLNYYTRPDYLLLYNLLENIRTTGNIRCSQFQRQFIHIFRTLLRFRKKRYSDPYDWEFDQVLRKSDQTLQTQQSGSSDQVHKQLHAGSMRPVFRSQIRPGGDLGPDINPFPAEYFASNPLGF
ncbi:hypothetical protein ANCCAN_19734 [Ancylostoma caninum]|uniref:Protein kinase domain-containing protein n=1 Tax=Ancylostoma caninum TaxID=29170 RepID=A0A368FTU9_ANCCA|nr:hypothetical protein ANCCAN_19734 [Ancylostoma caninum]